MNLEHRRAHHVVAFALKHSRKQVASVFLRMVEGFVNLADFPLTLRDPTLDVLCATHRRFPVPLLFRIGPEITSPMSLPMPLGRCRQRSLLSISISRDSASGVSSRAQS